MKACVFPGQGAQSVGMGEGLFELYPEMTTAADAALGYSVAELCLEDPERRLALTQHTQPALYAVSALAYRRRLDAGAPPPDFLAGHSLGEYVALWAAGVFDFETGLRLVKRRGELMASAAGGAMAAVLGCDAGRVAEVLREHGLTGLEIANYNTPTQVVLAGPAEEVARAEGPFVDLGATFIPLKNVSAAFHSRFMAPLAGFLGEALAGVELRPPRIPVISNVTARPYGDADVADLLRRQLREPVRWTDTVLYLLEAGVDDFEEVGPGGVLTKLVKAVRRHWTPPAAPAPTGGSGGSCIAATALGAPSFRRDHGVRAAFAAGALERGVSSPELVVRLARAGHLAYYGAGGLAPAAAEEGIRAIRRQLDAGQPFGVGVPAAPDRPEAEADLLDLCLRHGVRAVETAGFVAATPALVRYRLKGLSKDGAGALVTGHKVMARVSRPEVAAVFLEPPPERLVAELLEAGLVTPQEARWARRIPLADDLCVDGDADGLGGAAVLLPAVIRRRDEARRARGYEVEVRVGCAGEVGTPEAAAASFLLGADFLVAASIHQCTAEAGTSDAVKDLLQTIGVQDTEPAPAGELFELGGRVQVVRRETLFAARARRLHDLWRHHAAWEEVDPAARARVERDCLGRPFEQAVEAARALWPREAAAAERDPRHRMALAFRWYCERALELALAGAPDVRSYQVRCGPAMGACNQWLAGTRLKGWRHRHADVLADEVMNGAAEVLADRLRRLVSSPAP